MDVSSFKTFKLSLIYLQKTRQTEKTKRSKKKMLNGALINSKITFFNIPYIFTFKINFHFFKADYSFKLSFEDKYTTNLFLYGQFGKAKYSRKTKERGKIY